jgi:hypothetical protein
MPRYAMPSQDMVDLIAYLRRLGTDFDPGLSGSVIRVGSVFPKDGPLRPHGEVARALLKAYFDDINDKGGIYGRKIELDIVEDLNGGPVMSASERRLFAADPVFAVVSAFAIGRERELFPVFANDQVPVIGPLTLFAGHTKFQNDLIFHVLTGLVDQARALTEFAALELRLKPKATAVILPRNPIFDEIAEAVRMQGDTHDWPAPIVLRMTGGRAEASDHAAALHQAGVEAIFYFGPNGSILGPMVPCRASRPRRSRWAGLRTSFFQACSRTIPPAICHLRSTGKHFWHILCYPRIRRPTASRPS